MNFQEQWDKLKAENDAIALLNDEQLCEKLAFLAGFKTNEDGGYERMPESEWNRAWDFGPMLWRGRIPAEDRPKFIRRVQALNSIRSGLFKGFEHLIPIE